MSEQTDSSSADRDRFSSSDDAAGGNGSYGEVYSAGADLMEAGREKASRAILHIFLVVILAVAGAAAYWWWVQGSIKITELVKEARDLQKADDFVSLKESRGKFLEAMAIREDDRVIGGLANVSVSLWGLHGIQEMQAEGDKYTDQSVQRDIPSGDRYAAVGYRKIFGGDPAGAENELNEILKLGVADPKILHAVGLALAIRGQTRNAREYFRKAIDLSAGEARYSVSMADAYYRDGEYANAFTFFNRSVVANQGHLRGRTGKLLARTKQGANLESLNKEIGEILAEPPERLSPSDRNFAEYTAAEIAFAGGENAKATKFVDDTLARDDKDPRLHYLKGHLLYRGGKLDEALASFERAKQLDPFAAAYYFDVAEILRGEKRAAEAVALIRSYGEKNYKSDEYKLKLAAALVDKGDVAEAEKMLSEMLERDQYNADILFNLGYCYERQEKWDLAREKYGTADQYRQGWGDPWFRMGHVSIGEKDYATAREYFDKALEKYVRTNAPRKQRAQVYFGIASAWDKDKDRKSKKKAAAAREKAEKLLK